MRLQSLGCVASQANALIVAGATNATPIVVSITTAPASSHRLQVGQRVAIQGVTGNTGANGIWTISAQAAGTITLDGSVGNGTYGGSPTMAVVMDKTPFMRGHSAVAYIVDGFRNQLAFDGTVIVEGSNQTDAAWQSSPTYVDATLYGGDGNTDSQYQQAIPASGATNDGINELVQLKLFRYMRLRCSAYTAGGVKGYLLV
jgi:hypothetical protein